MAGARRLGPGTSHIVHVLGGKSTTF